MKFKAIGSFDLNKENCLEDLIVVARDTINDESLKEFDTFIFPILHSGKTKIIKGEEKMAISSILTTREKLEDAISLEDFLKSELKKVSDFIQELK